MSYTYPNIFIRDMLLHRLFDFRLALLRCRQKCGVPRISKFNRVCIRIPAGKKR